jgi:hypothetical protein
MKNTNNDYSQILNLGSLHEEIAKEQERKKGRTLPIIMMIISLILIGSGVFYPQISKLIETNKNDKDKTVVKKNTDDVLTCSTTTTDTTIGITTTTKNIYTFKNDLLKELKVTKTYKVIENNYDAGVSNISLYNTKYQELSTGLASVEGIKLAYNLDNNTLIATTDFSLDKVDQTKIPQNNLITLSNKLDQTKKEIKEIEGKAGHICR